MITTKKKKDASDLLIVATVLTVIGVCALVYALSKSTIVKQKEQDTGVMKVISKSTYNGYPLTVFQDTLSNARVFHYRDSMVVLPEGVVSSRDHKIAQLTALVREYEYLLDDYENQLSKE